MAIWSVTALLVLGRSTRSCIFKAMSIWMIELFATNKLFEDAGRVIYVQNVSS